MNFQGLQMLFDDSFYVVRLLATRWMASEMIIQIVYILEQHKMHRSTSTEVETKE